LLTVRAAPDPILRFENVSKTFQGQVILDNLSLDMQQGEFLTLLGPSGCGKTTSLNLVAGLIQPDHGIVYLRGKPANALPPRRRGLGLVFQSWALFPHLCVFDNIAYGLRVRFVSATEIAQRVKEMLDLVRLPGIEQKFPSQLSGGMQQRVALARALCHAPDLLLLDEPLSNLDAALAQGNAGRTAADSFRTERQHALSHAQPGGSAGHVRSHRGDAARQDRMHRHALGRLHRPPQRFVCTFVGDANVFDCDVVSVEQGRAVLRRAACICTRTRRRAAERQRLTVAIRPENVSLHRAAAADTHDGSGEDAIFKGNHILDMVEAGADQLHILTLPPLDDRPFEVGDKVRLTVPQSHVIALADEATHG
jgi:ABC-type Fe3+/spermidine/putrescine transport system ATPase subunit